MRTLRGLRLARRDAGSLFPQPRAKPAAFVLVLAFAVTGMLPGESLAASPASTQKRLNAVASRINKIESSLARTKMRAEGMQKSIRSAEARLVAARKGITALTQGLYMGTLDDATAFMNARSVTEFGDRVTFVEFLRAGDRDTLERVSIAKVNLQRQQKTLASVLRKQEALLRSLDRERAALGKLFREQRAALAAAERARRNRASRASDFTLYSGRGPFEVCPVDRPRAYSNDYGAPRVGHRHQGNDILAPFGTPIRAPFDGTFKGNQSRMGGNQARVFGKLGYVFNAHLQKFAGIRNGAFVKAGTIIGYVGDTGNARGGPPHDHFEWHPGGGRAVNPYRYLNLVC